MISIICGFVTAWIHPAFITLAMIPMAISAGALAALIHFDCKQNKFLKFIAPVLIILSDWILNGFTSIGGIIIVTLSLMIFLVYEQRWAKCESTLIISLIVAGLIALMFVAIGLANEEKLSLLQQTLIDDDCYLPGIKMQHSDVVKNAKITSNGIR